MLARSKCLISQILRPFLLLIIGIAFFYADARAPLYAQTDDGQTISSVEIDGLLSWQPDQIQSQLKSRPGQPYRATDVQQDLEALSRLMNTAVVKTGTAPDGGLILHYIVTEFPRFNTLQVIGNQKLTTARIETILGLKKGDPLNEQTQRGLIRSIRNEYKAIGMPQARVSLKLIPAGQTEGEKPYPQADLQFIVDEGRQVLIDDVDFTGDKVFISLRLKALMMTRGSWGFIKNYYDEEQFEDDLARLRDFYAAHGYFDARIEREMFQERQVKDKPVITPVIRIEAGQRYVFGTATILGARLIIPANAQRPFEPLMGKPFDGRSFGSALEQLRQLYLNHGLLTTEIRPEYTYNTEDKVLDMTIHIQEKDRIYVGAIKLNPNRGQLPLDADDETGWFRGFYDKMAPPIKQEAILRNVLLEPGDIYNKQLEQQTLRRLARLGVFEDDKLKAYNQPTAEPGLHNMVIETVDSNSGSLSGGIGFGDATGVFLFGSIKERNVGGEGDVLTLSAMLGTRNSNVTLEFLDRYLGQSDDSMRYKLFFNNGSRPGYRFSSGGLNTEWGHPIARTDWTAYLGGRLEYVDLREKDDKAQENLNRNYGVITGRLAFEEDTRYPFSGTPREGYLQSLSVEAGYAGGGLMRLEGSREQYWPVPLAEQLTYHVAANVGLMPYSYDTLPIHERYFLGGDNDMRGFAYRGAGYFDRDDTDVPIGGAAKFLVRNEILFPIYEPVSGVLFADIGSLARTPVDWDIPRLSVGPGVRLNLKNVEVAVDLAAPVIKQSDDQTRFFHFSIKTSF